MKRATAILNLLCLCLIAFGQTDKQLQHIRQQRIQWIHVHHLGFGVEADMFENFRISPRLFYSFGSYRNIASVDGGVKYVFCHPMQHIADEKVTAHYIAPFIGGNIHFGRWSSGCVYAGGEVAYNFAVAGNHHLPQSDIVGRDVQIGAHHCSCRAKLGLKFDTWELNIHYEYDLSPAFNQKYIFESTDYEYDLLRPTLYERWRVGVSVAYMLPFKR